MFSGFIQSNLKDLRGANLWKSALAEFLGTAYLVFLGCASCLGSTWGSPPANVEISLTFGLAVATVVYCIGHVSGGHVNPAVTCAMLITRRITLARCVVYIVTQCLGAVAGASIVKVITPLEHSETYGLTHLSPALESVAIGLVLEAIITFLLVFTVFACCDSNKEQSGSVPLTIGLSVAVCHFASIKYTGASMNPARTFGPAFIAKHWDNHWVYWVGPIFGGLIAALMYDLIFAENASSYKITRFLSREYDGDRRTFEVKDSEMKHMKNEQNIVEL